MYVLYVALLLPNAFRQQEAQPLPLPLPLPFVLRVDTFSHRSPLIIKKNKKKKRVKLHFSPFRLDLCTRSVWAKAMIE